jgi:hypothetical protein
MLHRQHDDTFVRRFSTPIILTRCRSIILREKAENVRTKGAQPQLYFENVVHMAMESGKFWISLCSLANDKPQ